MENIITKQNNSQRAKTLASILDMIIYLYILLFFYTAFSKIITYSSFVKVLSELPIIGSIHWILTKLIIGLELIFGIMLIVPKMRIRGLWGSLVLMSCFTVYLGYHVAVRSHLPCSCGGAISAFNWPQHVAFNLLFIFLAILGLVIDRSLKKTKISTRGDR